MNNRATGRTFRNILTALIAASNGKRVFYVCNHNNQRDFFKRAVVSVQELIGVDSIRVDSQSTTIIFPNDGILRFVSSLENLRGVCLTKIIHDDVEE